MQNNNNNKLNGMKLSTFTVFPAIFMQTQRIITNQKIKLHQSSRHKFQCGRRAFRLLKTYQ